MNAANTNEAQAKITRLHIKGLRSLEDVTLDLDGLTVLIGSNGSGKSSVVEACELLRRIASTQFIDEFHRIHGGFSQLLRHGEQSLELQVEGSLPTKNFSFMYSLTLSPHEASMSIHESFSGAFDEFMPNAQPCAKELWVERNNGSAQYTWCESFDPSDLRPRPNEKVGIISISPQALFLHQPPHEDLPFVFRHAIEFMKNALSQIDIHIPFDVTARWARKAFRKPSELRESAEAAPTNSLAMTGYNLVNAYHALKNNFSSAHWEETMDYVRLGLGNDIDSINTRVGGNGDMGLSIKYHLFDKQVATSALSDGELAYLAFVAMFRLNRDKSLLVFDEPDLHLHPKLTMRVLDLFASMAEDGMPIIITTHSDRLLDGLRDPANSVVLCTLNQQRATELYRPDPEALADWLTDYRGLGAIRSDGHEASILTEKVSPASPDDSEP